MDAYAIVKTRHVVSSTVLFGTGAGIAFFLWRGMRSPALVARRFAAATTVTADLLFTTPSVVVQPLTGAWLIRHGGFDWADRWLVVTYALYLLAGAS